MKYKYVALAVLSASGGAVYAGGLDRSGQSVAPIFTDSGSFQLTLQRTFADVTGTDALGNSYSVGEDFTQLGASYTRDLSDRFSLSLIYDQPYGADVLYNNSPLASTLGGTRADLNSHALSVIGKYRLGDRFSVFGGIKAQSVDAEVDLNGIAYRNAISTVAAGRTGAPLATLTGAFEATGGYRFEMDSDTSPGALLGGAYDIPDIALRVALTYHFEIKHSATTTENLFGATTPGTVDYVTPQSLNLEFQTGIAKDTLLTAGYRWTDFSAVDVVPVALGSDLVNLDDSHRFSVGVARRFNENLVGSLSIQYEAEGDDLVSPLGPTNGQIGISLGARYTKDNVNISGGINYTKLGDARPEVGGTPVASFSGSSALTVGFRAEITF
jgi:long-subunit fatty acid transport protein